MDGATAAKFARYRYASNDFSRAARQQQLIWAIREKAMQTDIFPKIPELWKALSKTFKTDLSLLDVIRLARFGSGLSVEPGSRRDVQQGRHDRRQSGSGVGGEGG